MKRLLLFMTITGLLAGHAGAATTFSLSNAQALTLSDTYSDPSSTFLNVGLAEQGVGGKYPTDGEDMIGQVGYLGNLSDRSKDGSASVTWSYTAGPDLSSFDYYAMLLSNDNQSRWDVELFLTAGGTTTKSGKVELQPGGSKELSIDLAGLSGLSSVSSIGYIFGSDSMGVGGVYPSATDSYHISVTPVPLPGALLLGILGVGVAGLKLRKRRV